MSVMLMTYGHEAFVTQAVDSVLAQKTDFHFELLISEDFSQDNTREIVRGLHQRYPERIRLFLSERNQRDNEVLTRAWEAARGRYIAVLDGDDYWTDPLKLQKQVNFLEKHLDIFVCGHAVTVIDEEGNVVKERLPDITEDRYLSPEDLAWGFCFPILSILFRNNKRIPPYADFNDVFNADNFMFCFFGNFGGGYISKEIMGAYRIHAGGAWTQLDMVAAIDHRNKTLSRIPGVLRTDLKAISYGSFLWHSIREDFRWSRKIRNIPYALAMAVLSLRLKSAKYLAVKTIRRILGPLIG